MPVTGARLSCRRIAGACRQTAPHPVAEPFHQYPIPHGSTFAATLAGGTTHDPRACHDGVTPGITESQYPSLQYRSVSALYHPVQTPFTGVRRKGANGAFAPPGALVAAGEDTFRCKHKAQMCDALLYKAWSHTGCHHP